MSETLKIREDDLLWKFYCKRFVLEGRPIPKPTNLCPYFWTAIHGLIVSLFVEVSLVWIWTPPLSFLAIFLMLGFWAPEAPFILIIGPFVICLMTLVAAIYISGSRLHSYIEKRAPWIFDWAMGVIVFAVLGFTAFTVIRSGNFSQAFRTAGSLVLTGIGLTMALIVVSIVITFLAAIASKEKLGKLNNIVSMAKAFTKAKWNRVCPPVELLPKADHVDDQQNSS